MRTLINSLLLMSRIKYVVCTLLSLACLNGTQAGEVWKGEEKVTDSQAIELLAAAAGGDGKEQLLAGTAFRHFHQGEFYGLLRQAEEKRLKRPLTEAEKKDWKIKINFEGAEFDDVELRWLAMPGVKFNQARFTDVIFQDCTLTRAGFERTEFLRAWFLQCDLAHASFNGEDRSKGASDKQSERRSKKPSEIWFGDCNLADSNFRFAWMTRVAFDGSFLTRSDMSWARFDSTIYDPMPSSLPFLPSFARFEGLENFFYQTSPTGLTELRNAFKTAGLRREERQLTAALSRQQMREGNQWEGRWKRLLFDLPSAFGMFPGRPLRILFCLSLLFTLPYSWAILRRTPQPEERDPAAGESRIWQVPLEKRFSKDEGRPRLLYVDLKTHGLGRGVLKALGLGFLFSLISTFGVGYKDLDVGRWIERIKRDESTLRATGWLRTVSGVQGLVSFYLLVLWLLTYFGRPFE